MADDGRTFTIIQGDGLYPDDTIEQATFAPHAGQKYVVDYRQAHLYPNHSPVWKPWSDIPEELRNRVNGLMTLKMRVTAEDVKLFPQLKV